MGAHLRKAEILYDQGRYNMAEEEAREELGEDPESAHAYALRAFCLARLERLTEALEDANEAVGLAPDWDVPHRALSFVHCRLGSHEHALAAIHEAIRLKPDDAESHGHLAHVFLMMNQPGEALKAAHKGLRLDPENPICMINRVASLVKLGRKREARKAVRQVIRIDPENPVAHTYQGWFWIDRQEPEKAIAHFQSALRLDPESAWAQEGVYESLRQRNPVFGALASFIYFLQNTANGQSPFVLAWFVGGFYLSFWPDLPLGTRFTAFLLGLVTSHLYGRTVISHFSDFLLSFDRMGRRVLPARRLVAGLCVSTVLVVATLFLVLFVFLGEISIFMLTFWLFWMAFGVSLVFRGRTTSIWLGLALWVAAIAAGSGWMLWLYLPTIQGEDFLQVMPYLLIGFFSACLISYVGSYVVAVISGLCAALFSRRQAIEIRDAHTWDG